MIISNPKSTLYQSSKGERKAFCMLWANSDLESPANAEGTNIIACAKMIGITPAELSFNGIYCLAPKIFFSTCPPVVLLAYCTGICLTAKVRKIQPRITNNHKRISTITIIGPCTRLISAMKAWGIRAIIPTIIRREIPFPTPLSVIFSPSHIAKTVPVTKIITEGIMNPSPFPKRKASSGTPNAPIEYK